MAKASNVFSVAMMQLPPIYTANLWVGVGCQKGASAAVFEQAIQKICRQYFLDWNAITGLATLDRKSQEPGLVALGHAQAWPLLAFTTAELRPYAIHFSTVVEAAVGVPSVCEAAALRAAAVSLKGDTYRLIVPKQVFHHPEQQGVVTVAIAQIIPKTPPLLAKAFETHQN